MDFIFDPSLVLYLPLYELDGASFMSEDAYGHLCTVTGALWTPQGRDFDGLDDWITMPSPHSLLTSVSVEAWIKPDTTQPVSQGNVVCKVYEYQLRWLNTEYVQAEYYTDSPVGWKTLTSLGKVPNLTWGHTLITLEPSDSNTIVKIYINGKLDNQVTLSGRPIAWNPFTIGSYWTGNRWFYKGLIGEVRLYNRQLTPLEVQHNYLATKWRYQK